MSLRFIIGRAGAGKTYFCLEAIRKQLRSMPEGPALIFLVPEQATFETEKELFNTGDIVGTVRAHILGFRRLAWMVLRETGGDAATLISSVGKHMLLRKILGDQRERLRTFGNCARQQGFIENLISLFSEMKAYKIDPKTVSEKATQVLQELSHGDSFGTGIKDKLHDLNIIYGEFERLIQSKYLDPDDYLRLLIDNVHRCSALRGAHVWIDGFSGFTPLEYEVLERVLAHAQDVEVALCMDQAAMESSVKEGDVFYPIKETYEKLSALALKMGVEILSPKILETSPRFDMTPEISHLEKHLFSHPIMPFAGNPTGIVLVDCDNLRCEIEAVAREIIRLCRDNNYRWKDISVMTRDLSRYQELISTVFSDHLIPFFIDMKRQVKHHPLIELVKSALQVVILDWPYEAVFHYLKTDLVDLPRNDVDKLENYVLAYGITGSEWTKHWTYHSYRGLEGDAGATMIENDELSEINCIRERAMKYLRKFQDALSSAKTVVEITVEVYQLLEDLEVAKTLDSWSKQSESLGNLEEAKEHPQVWSGLMAVFDEMVECLGEENISLERYLEILTSGLEGLSLAQVPPGLDQVFVGALDRSRTPNVKACFLIGANEGVLPLTIGDAGILKDDERERLRLYGLDLAPTGRRRLFEEMFLVYIGMTRAGRYLWISYPHADDQGKSSPPSWIIRRLHSYKNRNGGAAVCIFPNLNTKRINEFPILGGDSIGDLEYVTIPQRSLAYLATQLPQVAGGREISPVWWGVYNWFLGHEQYRSKLVQTIAGLFYENYEYNISPIASSQLFGSPLRGSVYRLEKFHECPFSHYLAYGLRLKERAVYDLRPVDLGEFYHACLKKVVEALEDYEEQEALPSQEDYSQLVNEIVEDLVPKLQNQILLSSYRYRYLVKKMKNTLLRATLALAEHSRRSKFRPIALEVPFGNQEVMEAVCLPLVSGGEIIQMSGRIDRIDAAETADAKYVRVIDYKSGNAGISLTEVYYGLKIQLLFYLDTAISWLNRGNPGTHVLPGGMLYFPVRDPILSKDNPLTDEDAEKETLKSLRMKGLVLKDTEIALLMDKDISGSSDIIPVGLKKDGGFYRNSSVVSLEQFNLLRAYVKNLLVSSGERICSGDVSISPYRLKNRAACDYCTFTQVCQFDESAGGNSYRHLWEEGDDIIWTKIHAKAGPRPLNQV